VSAVPPITAAAMTKSSDPRPTLGSAELQEPERGDRGDCRYRAHQRHRRDAIAYPMAMPLKRAARALLPMACKSPSEWAMMKTEVPSSADRNHHQHARRNTPLRPRSRE